MLSITSEKILGKLNQVAQNPVVSFVNPVVSFVKILMKICLFLFETVLTNYKYPNILTSDPDILCTEFKYSNIKEMYVFWRL